MKKVCDRCEGNGYIFHNEFGNRAILRCRACFGYGELYWTEIITESFKRKPLPNLSDLIRKWEVKNRKSFKVVDYTDWGAVSD